MGRLDNILKSTKSYGVGGIYGDRFLDVGGWEKTTVGYAGNVYSRLANENGIQPVDPALTAAREPFRVGRFLVKMMRTVPFFHKKVTAAWRYILEDTVLELNGIQDYSFEVFKKQHGVIRQDYAYGGIFKETNGDFTIRVPEYSGQLVRKALDYWFYGMSDPKTGVAHFYGKDIRDLQPNKSMSILFVLLGPTCRSEDIEYACMWHDCIPSTPKHAHNNSGSIGESGQGVEHDISFSGIFDRSAEIDRLAAIIVDREGLYEERAQNALLPKYIYDEYMSSVAMKPEELWAYSGKLMDRLHADSEPVDSAYKEEFAYKEDGGLSFTAIENFRNANKSLFSLDGQVVSHQRETAGQDFNPIRTYESKFGKGPSPIVSDEKKG